MASVGRVVVGRWLTLVIWLGVLAIYIYAWRKWVGCYRNWVYELVGRWYANGLSLVGGRIVVVVVGGP